MCYLAIIKQFCSMITETFAQHFANEWVTAWNDHDLDLIMTHYSEKIVFTSPFIVQLNDDATGTISSKAELRKYFGRALEKFPQLHFGLQHTFSSVNSLVLCYTTVNDLIAAECMVFDTAGKIVNVLAHYSG